VGDTDVDWVAWPPVPIMSTMNEAEATIAKQRHTPALRCAVDMWCPPEVGAHEPWYATATAQDGNKSSIAARLLKA
jgi:hypothetical protein